ncbi:MAG: methyltransferase [Planctomycetaceae bacterium]|nr:methyltransferase [Planctomycetaceae bacterium]
MSKLPNERIVCDGVLSDEYDRVMPVFGDESALLAIRLAAVSGKTALDLGTGSGVLAIHVAHRVDEVVGVDINPKAIRYARRSAEICEVQHKCSFVEGDLYGPVSGRRFDVIAVNPPFVPIPYGYRMFLSADGGPDGMDVVREALQGAPRHLAADGRLLMLTMSLGDELEPLVYRYLRSAFHQRPVRITTTHIYATIHYEAEPFLRLFENVPAYLEWRRFLERKKLSHLYYMLHDVSPHDRFEHTEEQLKTALELSEYSGSWEGRINRFRTWFALKCRTGAVRPQESHVR